MKKKMPDKKDLCGPSNSFDSASFDSAQDRQDGTLRAGIAVNIKVSCCFVKFDRKRVINMVSKVTGQYGIRKAVINFAVMDDDEIKKLNRKFLKRPRVTDVISFDISDSVDSRVFDIAVNAEMARRQAKKAGHSAQSELALYFLHGLLHNLGFSDTSAGRAEKMHKVEDYILEKFGYGTVYSEGKNRQGN